MLPPRVEFKNFTILRWHTTVVVRICFVEYDPTMRLLYVLKMEHFFLRILEIRRTKKLTFNDSPQIFQHSVLQLKSLRLPYKYCQFNWSKSIVKAMSLKVLHCAMHVAIHIERQRLE